MNLVNKFIKLNILLTKACEKDVKFRSEWKEKKRVAFPKQSVEKA